VRNHFALFRSNAEQAPNLPAISEYVDGGWKTTTRAELQAAIGVVADNASQFQGPLIVVLDGSAASVAVLLGLLAGPVDVLCLEPGTSHLADKRSVVWDIGAAAVVAPSAQRSVATSGTRCLGYGQLLTPTSRTAPDIGRRHEGDSPAVLLLTSGADSEPRVARQLLPSVLRGAALYRGLHGYQQSDRLLLPVPIAHSFGLVGGLLAGLGAGAELLTLPHFSLSGLRFGLERGATVLLGSPLMYTMLIRALSGVLRASRLRVLLSSGGPLPEEVATEMERHVGRRIRQVYGSTETGLIACHDGSRRDWTTGSVGVFAPGVEWKLAPQPVPDPAEAADRPSGRPLVVRTSTMFAGYAGIPAESPWSADGFYDTGDVADVSDSGEVFLVGRKGTFVNVGGKKVNPRRVERIILGHPDVAEVHVFGMSVQHEQAVHAAVVPVSGSHGSLEEDIVEFCRSSLAPHETPHRVHVMPALPRTSLGTVDHTAVLADAGLSTPRPDAGQ